VGERQREGGGGETYRVGERQREGGGWENFYTHITTAELFTTHTTAVAHNSRKTKRWETFVFLWLAERGSCR
jgi:hypothetical protein